MTVRGNKRGNETIEQNANKDILFKLLWEKPNLASRRQLAHSASSSFPSHISRKLLLEEHKLNIQLEKIEKERRQFLHRNNSDKRLLRLAVKSNRALEKKMNSGQFLVVSDNVRFHSSASDFHDSINEGSKKSWTSATHGVFYQSGANSVRQLQIKKVCLLKKMAERNRMVNSLPWKRRHDAPQVPPPSRSPSKTNIIWVRVRNSSGEMEIDGFLRNKTEFEELLTKGKDSIVPTKIEIRVPREKEDSTGSFDTSDDWKTKIDGLKLEKNISNGLEKQENKLETDVSQSFESSRMDEQLQQTTRGAAVSSEVPVKQLAPTVKGLKISPAKIRRGGLSKLRSEEKEKIDEHDCNTDRNSTSRRSKESDLRSNESKDKPNAICTPLERDGTKSSRSNSPNDANALSNVKSGQVKSSGIRENIGSVRSDAGDGRTNIGSKSKIGSTCSLIEGGRRDIGSARKNTCCSREKSGNGRKQFEVEQNNRTGGKNVKESKMTRNRQKSKKNSPTIDKFERDKATVESKPGAGEMRIHAKAFVMTTDAKGRPGHKGKQQSKTSKTRHPGKKRSATKLPTKSCSAYTVQTSLNDERLRVVTKDIRSKSDTAAFRKVHEAIRKQERAKGTTSPERVSHSPTPIILPSQSQLQDFDKVARVKMRQTLAVKMRRHCYTGTWAFPPHAILVGQ